MNLKGEYESVCRQYISKFSNKQDLDFEYWVGDVIGGVAVFGDFYFNFQDIVWDINSEQPKDLIISWYSDCLNHTDRAINYYSYSKGLKMT